MHYHQPARVTVREDPQPDSAAAAPSVLAAGRRVRWLLTVVTSVLVALESIVFLGSRMDDPYIFARYADNLWRYGDFVWNAGELRIEGFSSWLWLGVYVVGARLMPDPVVFAKLVGVGIGAILAGSVAWVVLREGTDRLSVVAVLIVLVASPALAFYSASGMDHIAWALVGWMYVVWVGQARTVGVRHGLAAALGILVRPEGFLLFAPAAALLWIDSGGARGLRARVVAAARILGPGVALLVVLFLYRYMLFGAWLPNAAAVKHIGGPIAVRLLAGTLYVAPGLAGYLAIPVVALILSDVVRASGLHGLARSGRCARISIGALAFIVAVLGLAVAAGGDDVAAFGSMRLLLPSMVPGVFVLFAGFRLTSHGSRSAAHIAVLVLLCLAARATGTREFARVGTGATNLANAGEIALAWTDAFRPLGPTPLSEYLVRETPPGEFIAVPWAGLIPYQTALPTIDLLGLNDRVLGRSDPAADAAHVLERRPYFICENFVLHGPFDRIYGLTDAQLRSMGAFKAVQRALLRHPRLVEEYSVDQRAPVKGTCFRRHA